MAVGLSPLSPIGPVRPVYPTPGFAVDLPVLAFGLLVLANAVAAVPGRYAARTPTALVLRAE